MDEADEIEAAGAEANGSLKDADATVVATAATEAVIAEAEAVEPPKITTATEWRRLALPCLVRLPSGAMVKARRPDFHILLLDNVITVEQMQQLVGNTTRTKEALYDVGLCVLPHMVLEPVLVRRNGHAPADDLMVVEDIPQGDVIGLLMWGIGHMPLPTIEGYEG